MHITVHLAPGLPSLRDKEILARFRVLLRRCMKRGLRVISYSLMPNHIHLVAIPESREALRDATRYLFGQFARWLNQRWGRAKGKVFTERFYSVVGRTVLQAWNMLGYVLRNARDAGLPTDPTGWDPFCGVNEQMFANHPFLFSIFGPFGDEVRRLLRRLARASVPYVSRNERLQPCLPGLAA